MSSGRFYQKENVILRNEKYAGLLKKDLSALLGWDDFYPKMEGNIENCIGTVKVPVGLAGPLLINGEYAQGEFYVPMATTEGALISSFSRGMNLITRCGGVKTTLLKDVMLRSPVFTFENMAESQKLYQWFKAEKNIKELQGLVSSETKHGALVSIEPVMMGRRVFVRMSYETGDAAGMNMVTNLTHKICLHLKHKKIVDQFILEGNVSNDKKPSKINMLLGRGKHIQLELVVPESILRALFRATSDIFYETCLCFSMGAHYSGAPINGHIANGLAATYIALGQDPANVAEGCMATLYCEVRANKDLYIMMDIPNIIVGSVGGGTGLPSQKNCLEIVDCYGPAKAKKLAEIVAATCLAGELSSAGAMASDEFAAAHNKLGREKTKSKLIELTNVN